MRFLFIFGALFCILGALFALTDPEARSASKSLNDRLPAVWIPVQTERSKETFGRPPFNENTLPQVRCGPDSLRDRLLRAPFDERWEVAVSCFPLVGEEKQRAPWDLSEATLAGAASGTTTAPGPS